MFIIILLTSNSYFFNLKTTVLGIFYKNYIKIYSFHEFPYSFIQFIFKLVNLGYNLFKPHILLILNYNDRPTDDGSVQSNARQLRCAEGRDVTCIDAADRWQNYTIIIMSVCLSFIRIKWCF